MSIGEINQTNFIKYVKSDNIIELEDHGLQRKTDQKQ